MTTASDQLRLDRLLERAAPAYDLQALRRLPSEDRSNVVAPAISANPRDETCRSVRAFVTRHRAGGEIRYLNALRPSYDGLEGVSGALRPRERRCGHPLGARRIYSRSGRWLAMQHAGVDLSAANLVHDISLAPAR